MPINWPARRVLILVTLSASMVLLVIIGADFAQKLDACATSGGRWDYSAWRCDCGAPHRQPVRAGGYCDATLEWKVQHAEAIVRGICEPAHRHGRFGDLDVEVVFLSMTIKEWVAGDREFKLGDYAKLAYLDTGVSGDLCEGQEVVAILGERRHEAAYLVDHTVIFPVERTESTGEQFVALRHLQTFAVYHAENGSPYRSFKDQIPVSDFLYSLRLVSRGNS